MRQVRIDYADRAGRIGIWLMFLALVALAAAPAWGGRDDLRLLSEIYAYVGLASLWNLLAGYAGLVSVGQQAYVGLGAYLLFALTLRAGLPPLWAIPLAGVLLAVRANFDPAIGPARLIFGFESVIIGGLGSLWGTLIGGILLGVAQAIGAEIDPGWQTLAGHLVFLLVLAVRPEGLFPKVRG